MPKQFFFHAPEPRTFADKKGATKAIKRDLEKHTAAHGDVILETGVEIKEAGDTGRFGVVIFCDITPSAAEKLVGPELGGYVIETQVDDKPEDKPAPKKSTKSRRTGEINVKPTDGRLVACREGTVQQAVLSLLCREEGASFEDLRAVCVKRDGVTPWDEGSVRSELYYDMPTKGYGVRTVWEGDTPRYFVVLPEGYDAPLPPTPRKS